MADKRIIELANEKLVLADGDMTIVDSESGTYKYDLNRLAKKTITDTTLSVEGKPADAKAVGDALSSVDVDTVNNARQLLSESYVLDQEPYLYRASGGDGADRVEECIVGGTVAWNQLVQRVVPNGATVSTDDATTTVSHDGTSRAWFGVVISGSVSYNFKPLANHKYFWCVNITNISVTNFRQLLFAQGISGRAITTTGISCGIGVGVGGAGLYFNANMTQASTSTADTFAFKDMMLIDLTQMFGSTIADYIYSLEQATAGAGVAWFRKLFPKDYYPYDAGTLKSVEGVSAHEMTGFNQFNKSTGVNNSTVTTGGSIFYDANYCRSDYIPVVSGQYYINNVLPVVMGFDANKTFLRVIRNTNTAGTFTITDEKYIIIRNYGALSTKAAQDEAFDNACINLHWDGERDGEYEPYESHSYPLDSSLTLRGIPKLDANNDLYYDGDTYEADGTVTRKYGIVDLGTLEWMYNPSLGGYPAFYVQFTDAKAPASSSVVANVHTAMYDTVNANYLYATNATGLIAVTTTGYIQVKNYDYTDATAFKTAMSGVYLVYELATPTTETATPYTALQTLDPHGTEEFVSTGIVPVGHESHYFENLRSKIEGLPKDFSTLIAPTEKEYKATQNYTVGSLLIVDNILYKVTSAIANGGTITPNTNCTATTLAAVIAAL